MSAPALEAGTRIVGVKTSGAKAVPKTTQPKVTINPPKKKPAKKAAPKDESVNKTTTIIHKRAQLSASARAERYFKASHGRVWIAIEILVGSFCILTNVSASDPDKDFQNAVKQEAAFLFVMLVLSLMANAGPRGSNISAALGAVIVLTIMLKTGDPISRVVPGLHGGSAIPIPSADLSGSGGGLQDA